ncbi:hypothetical protein COCVIDRAFT_86024, partial [Bipolaris victoriae FI3]
TPVKRVRSERRCGRCSQTRHDSRTYQVELEDSEVSNRSKQECSILVNQANYGSVT